MFEYYVCVFVENVGGASGASHQDVAVFNPPTEFRPHFHVAGLRWIRAETCPDTSELRFRIDDAQKVCLILLLFHTMLSRKTIYKLPINSQPRQHHHTSTVLRISAATFPSTPVVQCGGARFRHWPALRGLVGQVRV